jgi:transposase
LEGANIKLDSVITDIVGKSGRAIIGALIAGETNPVMLAAMADRRIKASHQELREALRGRVTHHHRFLLHVHLQHIDFADAAIRDIDQRVQALITHMDEEAKAGQAPFRTLIALLVTIPGIAPLPAQAILAEIGADMTRFPTAGHLLSWAGLCPGNNESAGKRRSTRLRKGNRWLKALLVQCAWAAMRKKDSCFRAQFYRLSGRCGPKKASARLLPRSSPRPTTCSRMAHNSRNSELATSTVVRTMSRPSASSANLPDSASTQSSH